MEGHPTRTAPTIFDAGTGRAPAGWPFPVEVASEHVESEPEVAPKPEPEVEAEVAPEPQTEVEAEVAPEPQPEVEVASEPQTEVEVASEPQTEVVLEPQPDVEPEPEPRPPSRAEVKAGKRAARAADKRTRQHAADAAKAAAAPATEPPGEARGPGETGTTRTLERTETSRHPHPVRRLVGQAVAVLCLLAAVVLVVAAFLLVGQANEGNGLVTAINDLAGHLDLGVFDVDNGVMKFDGQRADLKNALFNRGLAALVWVLVGRVVDRLLGGRA